MIDLTASGGSSINKHSRSVIKKRSVKHHHNLRSVNKFSREKNIKYTLSTTTANTTSTGSVDKDNLATASCSRTTQKKKKGMSTATVFHSHDSNSCSLTTNENMIYSSCLFSLSINPKVQYVLYY
jgi:hypothetical protein